MEQPGSTATVEPQEVTASTIDPPDLIPASPPSDTARPGTAEAVAQATAVFREYAGFIRAVIRFQADGEFDVDDVFQEFFLRLVASPVSPNVVNRKAYLWYSVRYLLTDLARRRTMERRRWRCCARGTADIPDDGPVQNLIRQEELGTALAALVRFLAYHEARALLLRYQHACGAAEIAGIMGVDVRTASRYLCTGLKKLRQRLGWDRRPDVT